MRDFVADMVFAHKPGDDYRVKGNNDDRGPVLAGHVVEDTYYRHGVRAVERGGGFFGKDDQFALGATWSKSARLRKQCR
ncbi:hypothetical protein [Dokdonella sp.]|uniref:hypothetical protein n=1 Tax=Dokdonella sp. TaxID=2291710 RepID=UPI0035276F9F